MLEAPHVNTANFGTAAIERKTQKQLLELYNTKTPTMVKKILQTTNELQIQNRIAGSIAMEETNNIPEERLNSSEKQGNTANSRNSDCSNDNETGRKIKEEALDTFQTPKQIPEQVHMNPGDTTPSERNLQHIERMEEAFEDGYDTDKEIGPFWGATHIEGEQDPEERPLESINEAGNADGNMPNVGKSSGGSAEAKKTIITAITIASVPRLNLPTPCMRSLALSTGGYPYPLTVLMCSKTGLLLGKSRSFSRMGIRLSRSWPSMGPT